MGLAFDEQDLEYYTSLFRDDMKRDPTNVELFDMAQSNSEHSRHWFFGGNIVIDGQKMPQTLMQVGRGLLLAAACCWVQACGACGAARSEWVVGKRGGVSGGSER